MGATIMHQRARPRRFIRAARSLAREMDRSILGPPEHWAEVLTRLALDLGFGTFVLRVAAARAGTSSEWAAGRT